MSRLRAIDGSSMEALLGAAPGAWEADRAMRQVLIDRLKPRLFSLIGIVVAAGLRCERFIDDLRGPLQSSDAARVAQAWREVNLSDGEKAALAYAEKGTLDEAAVRKRDIDDLRSAGFSDSEILLIATTIAYHNYAIRMAAAFDVKPG